MDAEDTPPSSRSTNATSTSRVFVPRRMSERGKGLSVSSAKSGSAYVSLAVIQRRVLLYSWLARAFLQKGDHCRCNIALHRIKQVPSRFPFCPLNLIFTRYHSIDPSPLPRFATRPPLGHVPGCARSLTEWLAVGILSWSMEGHLVPGS